MNCFCGMVDRRKAFSLISSRDHCQRSSPSRISDTPRAGFEPAQNLSSGFVERSYAAAITTTHGKIRCSVDSSADLQNVHEEVVNKNCFFIKIENIVENFILKNMYL